MYGLLVCHLIEWLLTYDRRIAKRHTWATLAKTFDLLNFFGLTQSFFRRVKIFICKSENFIFCIPNLIWGLGLLKQPSEPGLMPRAQADTRRSGRSKP